MTEKGLLPREQAILTEIIEYYISNHEAVSARTLSKISGLSLSPTTIRNLMEDLSEAGYLTHRAAARGRVPTRKAFYIYISKVCGKPAFRQPAAVTRTAKGPARGKALVESLHQMGRHLAAQTGFAAVASLPAREHYPLDWVRLAAIDEERILVSVGTPFGDVWSKVVECAEPFPPQALADVEDYLNNTYRGWALAAIRSEIMSGEPKPLLEDALPLGAAFRTLRKAFEWDDPPPWFAWGEDALLRVKEMQAPEKMLRLHRALGDRALLERAARRGRAVEGGLVAIGSEVGVAGLDDIALVAFPFGWDKAHPGKVAVVGPLHMDYGTVLQLVASGADFLNRTVTAAVEWRSVAS